MKQIELLGGQMSDVLHNVYSEEGTQKALLHINNTLAKLAMQITGCRADQLANEDLDDKPIVRLYWQTLSELTSKMFLAAAQKQSYYREAD
jgi:hypothetical protein